MNILKLPEDSSTGTCHNLNRQLLQLWRNMETRLKPEVAFFSSCLSPELHSIYPNLIFCTSGTSVNFNLVDNSTKFVYKIN